MLQDGRLHLSGIAKLAPVLTEANSAALLARTTHETMRKIEELVAEVGTKPDVPPTMRKTPISAYSSAEVISTDHPRTRVSDYEQQVGLRIPAIVNAESRAS